MRQLSWIMSFAALLSLGSNAVAQHLPEGAFVASFGYGVVDSGFDQYDNSGDLEPKLLATGFGPLYYGAYLGTPLNPTPGVTENFSNVDLRTRGDVYGLSAHYGATEDLTVGVILRTVDVTTNIRGQDTTDFAVLSDLVKRSGSIVDEAELEDEVLTLELQGKHWYHDEYLDDDLRYKAAVVFGATYRGSVNLRNSLVRFALVELARMNRPPFLSLGYEGQLLANEGESGGWEVGFGARLQYHLEGDSDTASPNAILTNIQTSFLAPGSPQVPVIDDVRSEDHYGAEAFVNVTSNVWEGLSLGTGLSWHYEAETEFSRVNLFGNPADAFADTQRDTEERGYLHLIVEYDAIDEYLDGEWGIPWVMRLEIQDSIYGRNLSELSLVSARFSMPLVAGRSSAG